MINEEQEKGKALPKFGEWDLKDPATADGFTVIFNKARNEKKTRDTAPPPPNIVPQKVETIKKKPPPPSKVYNSLKINLDKNYSLFEH